MEERTCTKCGHTGPLETDFPKRNEGSYQGYRYECSTCTRIALAKRERKHELKHYHLTPEKYAEMSEAQNHRCLLCGRTASEADPKAKHLCVDHDHACCLGQQTCGQCIRGLICQQCNRMLGNARDDFETLLAAATYVKSWKNKSASTKQILSHSSTPSLAA
jgi:Recombination endonuclease VII